MTGFIACELDEDETLLWSGRPNPFRYTLYYNSPKIYIGIGSGFMLVLLSIGAISFHSTDLHQADQPPVAAILTLFFIATAMLHASAKDIYIAQKTVYALTNKRLIRASDKKNIKNTYFTQATKIKKHIVTDGSGNLYFTTSTYSNSDGQFIQYFERPDGFIGIINVDEVDMLLQKELQKFPAPASDT